MPPLRQRNSYQAMEKMPSRFKVLLALTMLVGAVNAVTFTLSQFATSDCSGTPFAFVTVSGATFGVCTACVLLRINYVSGVAACFSRQPNYNGDRMLPTQCRSRYHVFPSGMRSLRSKRAGQCSAASATVGGTSENAAGILHSCSSSSINVTYWVGPSSCTGAGTDAM